MLKIDRKKINKTGFATPRGGAKGAYQNHVVRSNKVIIPFEKLHIVDLENFQDGWIVRLFPEQHFEQDHNLKVGQQAFVLYRTLDSWEKYPPPTDWEARSLLYKGELINKRRKGVLDQGHYVLRIPELKSQGPPQGIFAPEYAPKAVNQVCKKTLACLIALAKGSPYAKPILSQKLLNHWHYRGVLKNGHTACPLCNEAIHYREFHQTINLTDCLYLNNAGVQVEGSTRSTMVNLFHLSPISYEKLNHTPTNVAWGHATCNTFLGQRACFSKLEMREQIVGCFEGDLMRTACGQVWIRAI